MSDDSLGRASMDYVHRSDRGEVRVWLAAPMVMVLKFKGHADAGYVDFVERVFERVFGQARGMDMFFDCEDQTGYDHGFRQRIFEWGEPVKPRTRTWCLLVRSRLVAFGITAVNVALGGKALVTTNRDAFDAKLEKAVRRAIGAP